MSTDDSLIKRHSRGRQPARRGDFGSCGRHRPGRRRRSDGDRGGLQGRPADQPGDRFVIQYDLGFAAAGWVISLRCATALPDVEKGWSGDAAATVVRTSWTCCASYSVRQGPFWRYPRAFHQGIPDSDHSRVHCRPAVAVVAAMSERPRICPSSPPVARTSGAGAGTRRISEALRALWELAVKVLEIGVGGYESPDAGGESPACGSTISGGA